MFFFQNPLADVAVGLDDLAFVGRLWQDWSPGYDATEDMAHVRDALGDPANLAAAIGYYRAMFQPELQVPELQAAQDATASRPRSPRSTCTAPTTAAWPPRWPQGAMAFLPAEELAGRDRGRRRALPPARAARRS